MESHREFSLAYSWKRIAGVGYEHTRLANSAVSHSHTLDESRCGHDDNDPFLQKNVTILCEFSN